MTAIGTEEGCPIEEPKELDAIIAKPSKQAVKSNNISLAEPVSTIEQSQKGSCSAEEQKQFNVCVGPLTTFQPHPLAVIKQPKQIDEACNAYKNFNQCRALLKCNPLWARGMTAMFEFACGPDGYGKFNNVSFF